MVLIIRNYAKNKITNKYFVNSIKQWAIRAPYMIVVHMAVRYPLMLFLSLSGLLFLYPLLAATCACILRAVFFCAKAESVPKAKTLLTQWCLVWFISTLGYVYGPQVVGFIPYIIGLGSLFEWLLHYCYNPFYSCMMPRGRSMHPVLGTNNTNPGGMLDISIYGYTNFLVKHTVGAIELQAYSVYNGPDWDKTKPVTFNSIERHLSHEEKDIFDRLMTNITTNWGEPYVNPRGAILWNDRGPSALFRKLEQKAGSL